MDVMNVTDLYSFTGIWHRKRYEQFKRESIGSGASGCVYLFEEIPNEREEINRKKFSF